MTSPGRRLEEPESTSSPEPGVGAEVPDSATGWRAVAAAFVALLVAFSVAYSFGAFVTPILASFDATRAAVGAVFSLCSFIFLVLGMVTGPIQDRYGPRGLVLAAAVLVGGGLLASAHAQSIAWMYLTYGICIGLGAGCIFVPVVANVGAWFVRRRGLALGIAASGVGLGTLCGAPLAAHLIDAYGWRAAATYLGLASACVLVGVAAIIPRAPLRIAGPTAGGRLLSFLGDREFALMYASGLCSGLALYVPFVFLPPFAEAIGISPIRAAALVSGIGLASMASRLVFGLVGDRLGVLGAFKLAHVLFTAAYVAWLLADGYFGLVLTSLLFGSGYGGTVALTPALLASYFGAQRLGSAMGNLYSSTSVGALFGAPVAGFLISASGTYDPAVAVFLGIAALGNVCVLGLRARNAT